MRTRLLIALLVAASALATHAQALSVYALSYNTRVSSLPSGVNSSNVQQYQSFFASGIGGGVTLGALPLGPIHIGFDLRGSSKSGNNGVDTAMAGVRLGVKPPLLKIKPYVQASAGYLAARSTLPVGQVTNKYVAYEIFGGIDYKILPILDFRVLEIGGGQGFDTGLSFTTSQHIPVFNINTGLVLHF